MKLREMTNVELESKIVGEPISFTVVIAVLSAAIIAVIIYKLFLSKEGSASLPGGWKFSWD